MAIKNRTVEIKGDEVTVGMIQILPRPDQSVVIVVSGVTRDSEGNLHALKEAQTEYVPGTDDVVGSLLAACLDTLRKRNGLEDAPIALELKSEVPALAAEAQPK